MDSLPNVINIRFDYIDLGKIDINMDILSMLSKEVMSKYCLIPFEISDNILHVAMSNPSNKRAIDDVKFLTKKDVKVYIGDKDKVLNILDKLYEKDNADSALEQVKNDYDKNYDTNNTLSLENSPVIKLTNSIINGAIRRGASDIHFEPFEDEAIVRYRIDGILHKYMSIPKEVYPSVCTRIKIQSSMDIADRRMPQDGKIQFKTINSVYDLRVSSLPTMYGEKIVIRILYKNDELMSLSALGFDIRGCDKIERFLKSNHGIILVTGPTGSGKTTTLYSMLNTMNKKDKNVLTIEDPVEYTIKGINQVSINTKAGLTFSSGLRSILRQDPNVIMIGEIRDEETAEIAVRAAITGHLVISTLHTNDAASSILRLIDMGVPNYLVADSLLLCIAQRLVRVICSSCKEQYEPSYKEKIDLHLQKDEQLYRGKGCLHCNDTGYKYRTAVYEIMQVDENLRRLIIDEKSADKIRDYNEKLGMINLDDFSKDLVRRGITTYEEYLKLSSSY